MVHVVYTPGQGLVVYPMDDDIHAAKARIIIRRCLKSYDSDICMVFNLTAVVFGPASRKTW